MEKFGFIYVWYDRKHTKFYIGRHWGTETDGYVCSSNSMREAHRRRPNDFKRRIVARINTTQDDLVIEEQRWLNMIEASLCGSRYYNMSLKSTTPSTRGYKHTDDTIRKIKDSQKGRTFSDDHKNKLRQAKIGSVSPRKGVKLSAEIREKISNSKVGKTGWKHTQESKLNLRNKHLGKILSEETKEKIRQSKLKSR